MVCYLTELSTFLVVWFIAGDGGGDGDGVEVKVGLGINEWPCLGCFMILVNGNDLNNWVWFPRARILRYVPMVIIHGAITGYYGNHKQRNGEWRVAIDVSRTRECMRQVPGSEIDLSQPRHDSFWWRHNGPVTSQTTDLIRWHIYP